MSWSISRYCAFCVHCVQTIASTAPYTAYLSAYDIYLPVFFVWELYLQVQLVLACKERQRQPSGKGMVVIGPDCPNLARPDNSTRPVDRQRHCPSKCQCAKNHIPASCQCAKHHIPTQYALCKRSGSNPEPYYCEQPCTALPCALPTAPGARYTYLHDTCKIHADTCTYLQFILRHF